ncbi:hypothetical protein Pla110_33710 [Polystyrenella longa]|uniref:Uncharacterized protein n=1 Tax=Polystyrenella longa TaxID=2528007 RepID=A0A518CQY9_9PLAN|nr:hypothetical protein [Polystyrenella longa]QDU81628.1 hypothetical protein Pla110_33710 [Polystyrenella longa]
MRFVLMCLAIVLCLTVLLGVLAFQYGGMWGLLGFCGLIVLGLLFLPRILKFTFKRVVLGALKKGMDDVMSHLKDAEIEVHQITAIPTPDYYRPEYDDALEFDGPETTAGLDWYEMEITVRPQPPQAGKDPAKWYVERLLVTDPEWEGPQEMLEAFQTKSFDEIEDEALKDHDETANWSREISRYWVSRGETWREVDRNLYAEDDLEEDPEEDDFGVTDEGALQGEQRLRVEISLPQGTQSFELRSMTQVLTEVTIPEGIETVKPRRLEARPGDE